VSPISVRSPGRPFFDFRARDILRLPEIGPRPHSSIGVLYFPDMNKDTKDIPEAANFIKDHMVTKAEFNEAVEKLNSGLTAVESKIGGIHNRIDDEALKAET
jgi:hypothetical protein